MLDNGYKVAIDATASLFTYNAPTPLDGGDYAIDAAALGGVFAAGLPAGYVLRCLLLRLADDLALSLVPLCLSFLLRGGYAAPLLAAAWGLLIYFRLPTDFLRWQPGAVWQPVALWPIPTAAVSVALSRVFFRKA